MAGDEAGGSLVLAVPQHDSVAWLDSKSGKWLETVSGLPKLAGMTVMKNGTVLAISNGAVVSLSRQSTTPQMVIAAEKMQSPWRLTVSAKSGEIFVAENSDLASDASTQRHHQVKRFSTAGRLLLSLGKPEGRGDGVYVATDFRGITDIQADPDGGFVVVEANEYPMGHLHTDAKSGDVAYYALNSGGGSPIYRITGWDGWHRASGTITLPAAATAVAKRDGTGLKAEYFNTPDCSGIPALTRTDKLIFFNWGKNAPDPAITASEFSVRWTGTYEAVTSEDTRFEIKLLAGERIALRMECGFITGNTRRVSGKVGQAIELTAGGEFAPAVFPIDEELRLPDTNYSVSFWFKTTAPRIRLCEARRYSSYNNRWSDHSIE